MGRGIMAAAWAATLCLSGCSEALQVKDLKAAVAQAQAEARKADQKADRAQAQIDELEARVEELEGDSGL